MSLTDHSKAVLLLLIILVIYASCLSCFLVCSLQPCGHLLRKGSPLGSLVCDVFLRFCHFPMWCPGSGEVIDCIDSWSLPSYLHWINIMIAEIYPRSFLILKPNISCPRSGVVLHCNASWSLHSSLLWFLNKKHTGQCKRTGCCYNNPVVAFFSTGAGVTGKKIYTCWLYDLFINLHLFYLWWHLAHRPPVTLQLMALPSNWWLNSWFWLQIQQSSGVFPWQV